MIKTVNGFEFDLDVLAELEELQEVKSRLEKVGLSKKELVVFDEEMSELRANLVVDNLTDSLVKMVPISATETEAPKEAKKAMKYFESKEVPKVKELTKSPDFAKHYISLVGVSIMKTFEGKELENIFSVFETKFDETKSNRKNFTRLWKAIFKSS